MMEQGVHEPVAAGGSAQRVAVGEQERQALMLDRVWVVENLEADVALQPARPTPGAGPVVVVAAHERDSDAAADGPPEGSEERPVAGRGRATVVEPEVEDVAQEVEPLGRLQFGEEGDEIALLGPVELRRAGSEMDIR